MAVVAGGSHILKPRARSPQLLLQHSQLARPRAADIQRRYMPTTASSRGNSEPW